MALFGIQWDGQPIGDGRPGPVARKLLQLWEADAGDPAQSVAVPYSGKPE